MIEDVYQHTCPSFVQAMYSLPSTQQPATHLAFHNHRTSATMNTLVKMASALRVRQEQQQRRTEYSSSRIMMITLLTLTVTTLCVFCGICLYRIIRVYRHPERYARRNPRGQVIRQNPTTIITQAILDTIPLVKFNDLGKTGADLEKQGVDLDEVARKSKNEGKGDSESVSTTSSHDAENKTRPVSEVSPAIPVAEHGANELCCSICMEEFVDGDIVRVLPCSHRFHPSCIDPWLLKKSGTCPLCRVELDKERKASTDTAASSSQEGSA
jgi:hypothetical protein